MKPMNETPRPRSKFRGAIRLFRAGGITVFLHWSWFLVAVYEIQQRKRHYSSLAWNGAEYLILFGLVLLHEFGHALACRSVGGRADRILLWPLGGVAFVDPPPRPGATLWSIAAGPLVNVALMPFLAGGWWLAVKAGWPAPASSGLALLKTVTAVNFLLLAFNLLPVYPLDGGQILRALLWFLLGRAYSLLVATIIGFFGVGGIGLLALLLHSPWLGVLAVFILLICGQGLRSALALARMERAPRRTGWACPACGEAPRLGAFWRCHVCQTAFDTFAAGAVCPRCCSVFVATRCPACGALHPLPAWRAGPPPLPPPLAAGSG